MLVCKRIPIAKLHISHWRRGELCLRTRTESADPSKLSISQAPNTSSQNDSGSGREASSFTSTVTVSTTPLVNTVSCYITQVQLYKTYTKALRKRQLTTLIRRSPALWMLWTLISSVSPTRHTNAIRFVR